MQSDDEKEQSRGEKERHPRPHKKRMWLWLILLLLLIGIVLAAVGIWIGRERKASNTPESGWEAEQFSWTEAENVSEAETAARETITEQMGETTEAESETQVLSEEAAGIETAGPSETTETSEVKEGTETAETGGSIAVRSGPIPLEASVEASSTLAGGDYDVGNLADEDLTTAWHEGAEGTGEGESITFRFEKEERIYGLAFIPGYLKSSELYVKNGHPVELRVDAGGMSMEIIIDAYEPDFESISASMLYAEFPEPIDAEELTVTIVSAVQGEKYEDTGFTEMFPYTYRRVG